MTDHFERTGNHLEDWLNLQDATDEQETIFNTAYRRYCASRAKHEQTTWDRFSREHGLKRKIRRGRSDRSDRSDAEKKEFEDNVKMHSNEKYAESITANIPKADLIELKDLKIEHMKFLLLDDIELVEASSVIHQQRYKGWHMEQASVLAGHAITLLFLPLLVVLLVLLFESRWAALGCTRQQCVGFFDILEMVTAYSLPKLIAAGVGLGPVFTQDQDDLLDGGGNSGDTLSLWSWDRQWDADILSAKQSHEYALRTGAFCCLFFLVALLRLFMYYTMVHAEAQELLQSTLASLAPRFPPCQACREREAKGKSKRGQRPRGKGRESTGKMSVSLNSVRNRHTAKCHVDVCSCNRARLPRSVQDALVSSPPAGAPGAEGGGGGGGKIWLSNLATPLKVVRYTCFKSTSIGFMLVYSVFLCAVLTYAGMTFIWCILAACLDPQKYLTVGAMAITVLGTVHATISSMLAARDHIKQTVLNCGRELLTVAIQKIVWTEYMAEAMVTARRELIRDKACLFRDKSCPRCPDTDVAGDSFPQVSRHSSSRAHGHSQRRPSSYSGSGSLSLARD